MTNLRLALLFTAVTCFGVIWEVDADRQQEIIGGQPVCNGRIWQAGISCDGIPPQCKKIRGAFVYQPILMYNNTYNHSDTRCSLQEFTDKREEVTASCFGGHDDWVERHSTNCIHDWILDGL